MFIKICGLQSMLYRHFCIKDYNYEIFVRETLRFQFSLKNSVELVLKDIDSITGDEGTILLITLDSPLALGEDNAKNCLRVLHQVALANDRVLVTSTAITCSFLDQFANQQRTKSPNCLISLVSIPPLLDQSRRAIVKPNLAACCKILAKVRSVGNCDISVLLSTFLASVGSIPLLWFFILDHIEVYSSNFNHLTDWKDVRALLITYLKSGHSGKGYGSFQSEYMKVFVFAPAILGDLPY